MPNNTPKTEKPIERRGRSCGATLDYSQRYDADYCAGCDRWREPACRDPTCEFCASRPARPSLSPRVEPAPPAPFNAPRRSATKARAPPARSPRAGAKNQR
jgi:hypothetical protein